MTNKEMELYDQIVELGIATPEEINLVRCIVPGSWEEILNNIIYVRTGYRTFDQLIECEMEEEQMIKDRVKFLKHFDNYIRNLDDEEIFETWISIGLPDEATEADLYNFAADEEAWLEMVSAFHTCYAMTGII